MVAKVLYPECDISEMYRRQKRMSVTKEQVLRTATLARLDLSEGLDDLAAEQFISKIASQMEDIVGYMDILNQVDTTGVEPLYSPMMHTAAPREDKAENRRTVEEVLANAPEKQESFFVVPPVL